MNDISKDLEVLNKNPNQKTASTSFPLNVLIYTASLMVILYGLKTSSQIFIQIVFALFMTILLVPLLNYLRKRGLPTSLSLLVIIFGFVLLVLAISSFLYVNLGDLLESYPGYQQKFMENYTVFLNTLRSFGFQLPNLQNIGILDNGNLFNLGARLITELVRSITGILFFILLVIFLIIESQQFPSKISKSVTNIKLIDYWRDFAGELRSFFYLRTLNNLIVAVAITLFLLIMRVDFAILWGFLAFILSYIPSIGLVIALIPAIVLSLAQYGLPTSLLVMFGSYAINFVGDNIIAPKLVGGELNLSITTVFISFIFWTWLFGLMGAFLSVPLTLAIKRVFDYYPNTKWLSRLMESTA